MDSTKRKSIKVTFKLNNTIPIVKIDRVFYDKVATYEKIYIKERLKSRKFLN